MPGTAPVEAGSTSLARRGRFDLDRGHVVPELLELVVPTRVRREDVQDDVEVVGEDPGPLLHPVYRAREEIQLVLQASVHLVPDGNRLARIPARGDDEVVGEVAD